MALITVKIDNIVGSADIEGYAQQIEAIAIRDSIFVPPPLSAGRTRAARTTAQSRHADIQLVRYRDVASPKLSEACSAGTALGTVTVTVFRTTDSGPQAYMVYTLGNTFVSRIETETDDDAGTAFLPYVGSLGNVNPSPAHGVGGISVTASGGAIAGVRLSPMPYTALPKGMPRVREVERIWFNATEIKWTYTPHTDGVAGGAIERGWNIRTGRSLV